MQLEVELFDFKNPKTNGSKLKKAEKKISF